MEPIESKTKICRNLKGNKVICCGLEKPITEFYGGKSVCKSCIVKYNKINLLRKNNEAKANFEELNLKLASLTMNLTEEDIKLNNFKLVEKLRTEKEQSEVREEEIYYVRRLEEGCNKLELQLNEANNNLKILQNEIVNLTTLNEQLSIKNDEYGLKLMRLDEENRSLRKKENK